MGPHLPVPDLCPVFGHMRQAGTTFYIPDIYPAASRDVLWEIIEEALCPWRNYQPILPNGLKSSVPITRPRTRSPVMPRVFELHQALYARHAAALKRTKLAIIRVFSMQSGVSDDTVARDLNFIAARLGPDWRVAPH